MPRILLAILALLWLPLSYAAAKPASQPSSPLPVPKPPAIGAKGYILMDYHSDQILAQDNADKRMEPASITKLMTAYLVFQALESGQIHMDDKVHITKKAWRTPGSRMFVKVNTKVSVKDLLQGMITQSGNDATVALAQFVAGSEDTFAAMMNRQAKALGMNHTHFVNPTGLPDPNHYTTAHDIAKLARALIRDFPEYYKLYSEKKFTWNNITQYNRNKLLWRDPSVDGMKTGHTESAGYCLVASAKRKHMRLISVVLGTKSNEARADASQALLNYGFRFFETHKLYDAHKPLTHARVWKGADDKLSLGLAHTLYVTVPRGQYKDLDASMSVNSR
ncbi:MAG TPA: D-alanyl-D-alanine carboxypeptidase family protein, partial [Gammaproteobacteria bacterium]|nr:D-alanyl-D-alanine carboxypeptidase family protein [Gammaproteobacteria bacterium]